MGNKKSNKAETKNKELKTCNFVKARHILCEKQGKIMQVWNIIDTEYLQLDKEVPPTKFGELAMQYSECSSAKKGGDLGWFPRGKMEPTFQSVAFSTPQGKVSQPFKGANGWHIKLTNPRILVEGRRA